MNAEVIFAPEAEQDIAEAYNWYEGRRVGPGEEFLSCVDAGIQKMVVLRLDHVDCQELIAGAYL